MVVLAQFLFYGTVLQHKSWSPLVQHCIQVAVTLAGDSQVKTARMLSSSVLFPGVAIQILSGAVMCTREGARGAVAALVAQLLKNAR